jgi:autotransporter-associated beta strand protein
LQTIQPMIKKITILKLFVISFLVPFSVFSQTTWTQTTPGTYNWTAPCGVSEVTIELWGGGGAGGAATANPSGGGGGAGGGYVKRVNYPVSPGTSYVVRVGAGGTASNSSNGNPGQSSFFISEATISAVGGNGGVMASVVNQSGDGGASVATGNVGFTAGFSFYGGAGGTGIGGDAGGGGGSAGTGSNGNSGNQDIGGAAVTGGGAGASVGVKNPGSAGVAGSAPGGGGSGGVKGNPANRSGGVGGAGRVVISYFVGVIIPTNITALTASKADKQTNVVFPLPFCYDDVLVVIKQGSSITDNPTGDGSGYNGNLTYGLGTAFDGGYVVSKGVGNNLTVSGLVNWQTYFVKVFTRKNSLWSSGVEISFMPEIPGYYWNGGNIAANPANGGTGTWSSANAWRQPSIGGAQANWAGGSTGIIKGTSGVISMNGNVSASKIFVVDNGFNLTPNTTTIRNFTGDIELYSNVAFSMNDITATTSRTINFSGNVTGTSMSKLVLNVNQISNNNSVLNLSANNRLIDVPLEIAAGSNAGTKGFAVINSTGGSNSFSSTAIITNNTSYPLSLCANTDETLTINAIVSGTGDIYFSNSTNNNLGIVLLNASSTYSGKTFLRASATGVVRLGINNALPIGTDVEFLNNNGSLDLNGFNQTVGSLLHSISAGGNITNSSASPSILTISGTTDATIFSRVINNGTGGIAVVKSGSNTQIFGAANTFANGLTINDGRIRIGVGNVGTISAITSSFAGTGTLTLNGGSLSSNGATTRTILNPVSISGNIVLGNGTDNGNLNFANVATITGSSRQITTESNVSFTNASNAISDGGNGLGITKLGSANLEISGQATYTGLTTVSEGTLILNRIGGATIPSGNDVVINGGTLRISRSQTINNLTLTSGTLEVLTGVTLTINGTFTGGGTIQNDGTITLVGPTAFPGATSTISSMNNLTINRAGGVNLDADLFVNGTLTLTSGDFQIGNNTLTLNGGWITGTINNLKSNSNSKLILNNTGSASTAFPNLSVLHSLTLNSDRTFNLTAPIAINNTIHLEKGTLNLAAHKLTISGSNLSVNSGFVSAASAFAIVEFANSFPLTVPMAFFGSNIGNLEMNSSSTVTLNDDISVNQNLTFTDGALILNGRSLSHYGNNIFRTSGGINGSAAGSQLFLSSSSVITLPDGLFIDKLAKLDISCPRVIAQTDFEISEELSLSNTNPNATDGLLDMVQSYGGYANSRSSNSTDANNNLNSKILTLGPNAIINGDADVTGKVKRYDFVSGADYAFGNKNMILRFDENGGSLPSEVMVVSTKGDEGLHVDKDGVSDFTPNTADTLIGGAAVKRMWQILRTGGTNAVRFTVRFPYLDSELNGNAEANLVTWDHHIPYSGLTPHEHGKTNINTTDNWVELSGHGLFYLAEEGDASFTKYWMLSEKVTVDTLWLGASGGGAGSSWTVPSNWSAGVLPSTMTKLIFDPNVYKTELSVVGTHEAGTIEIKPNGVIHGNNGVIKVNGGPTISGGAGSWVNQGRFEAGTSNVIFDYADATIAGATKFYNLTINPGAKVTITAAAVDTVMGTLTNNGILDATTFANTMVYAGNGQSIINPNGPAPGYHHLTIATGSNSIELSEDIDVKGNFLVHSGTFESDGKDVFLHGNFTNNAAAIMTNLHLLGAKQNLGGSTVTTFDDVVLRGSDSLILQQNIIVNGTLYLDGSKFFKANNHTIDLLGSIPMVNGQNFVRGTSTVKYVNSGDVNLGSADYFNLELLPGGERRVVNSVGVYNQLTVDDCVFDVQTGILSLYAGGTNSPEIVNGGSLNLTNGKLQLISNSAPISFGAHIANSQTISKLEQIGTAGSILTAALTITDSLLISSGTMALEDFDLTLDTDVKIVSSGGGITQNDGWLRTKAADFPSSIALNQELNRLELNRNAGTVQLIGNLSIHEELDFESGTFHLGNNKLSILGQVSRNTGKLNGEDGELSFENSNDLSLPNSLYNQPFKHLSHIGTGNVNLGQSTTISHSLNMSGGNLSTDGNILEIGTGVSQTGLVNWSNSDKRSVVGPMKRWFAAANNSSEESGIFPIGTSDLNRFVQINFTGNPDGGYIVAEFNEGLPPDSYDNFPITYMSGNLRRYIQNADDYGYWEITPYDENDVEYAALNNTAYDLFIRLNNPGSVQRGGILNDPPTIRIIRAKGDGMGGHNDWELAGTHSITQAFTTSEDYKIGSANVVGFSWFGAGGNNEFPLPVELLQFSGTCQDDEIALSWSTASEQNSAHFVIEHSEDGLNWRKVAKVEAAGNSQSLLKYKVTFSKSLSVDNNYFRLLQVDLDGSRHTYTPIVVDCESETGRITAFPNPSNGTFVIEFDASNEHSHDLEIVDLMGKTQVLKSLDIQKGINQVFLNEKIPAGMYLIRITANGEMLHQIKHVVE